MEHFLSQQEYIHRRHETVRHSEHTRNKKEDIEIFGFTVSGKPESLIIWVVIYYYHDGKMQFIWHEHVNNPTEREGFGLKKIHYSIYTNGIKYKGKELAIIYANCGVFKGK